MSLLHPKTTEEYVLSGLRDGTRHTTELLGDIQEARRITKQAFYAALRKLETEETITIYKKNVALNVAWIKDVARFGREIEQAYLPGTPHGSVLALEQGESVSYVFTSLKNLDAFWGHMQSVVVASMPISEPVYTYDPHYWFYLARAETEKKIVDDIAASGRQFLMTVGGKDPLDKILTPEFASDERQYHMEILFTKRNYYLVVIGDHVFEGWLDEQVVQEIDALYAAEKTADKAFFDTMHELIHRKARHKIRITRNVRKANQLKAVLGKNFYIKHAAPAD